MTYVLRPVAYGVINPMKPRKQISFSLPAGVADQLKKLANEQRRSLSAQAEIILADAVLRHATKQEAAK